MFSATLETPYHSIYSLYFDFESLPLLMELGWSQDSAYIDKQGRMNLGELDLYANHKICLKQNIDMVSETRLIGHYGHGQDIMGSGFLRSQDRYRSLS